jgi:hypothetical protein
VFFGAHLGRAGLVRHRRAVGVAVEFDVAAERQRRQSPSCAMPIIEAEDFGAKAKRKGVDLNAAPPADEEMAKLVEEYDQAQDENKRNYISC